MAKVTVVIPNYNGIKFLQDCLQALLEQEPGTPEYEVLVVDNGSQDGSLELIHHKFPQVQVEALSENTGFCHAVNVGIRKSHTPYVILLNNDTRVGAGFVSGLYRAIERRPKAFSVSASMRMWDAPELIDDAGDRYCALGWAYARGRGSLQSCTGRPGRYSPPAAGLPSTAERFFDGSAFLTRSILPIWRTLTLAGGHAFTAITIFMNPLRK